MNKMVERLSKWGTNNVWDNGTVVMNEYCIVAMKTDFEHQYQDINEFMMDKIRNHVDMVSAFEKELEVPAIDEIRRNIRELCGRKYSKRILYCFGTDLPTVNARYMLDIINNLKVTKIKWESPRQPLEFIGKNGTAILLPVVNNCPVKGYKMV